MINLVNTDFFFFISIVSILLYKFSCVYWVSEDTGVMFCSLREMDLNFQKMANHCVAASSIKYL